ncbi:MAG TPA: carboxypeptidase-like regulatory domain-containing protein, partial [Polyangiales bacterium]|nr:carboxypeptidase-like regulatory domain-containing protein [Polyangiales bacterium]
MRGKLRSASALAVFPLLLASVTACGSDDGPANGYYLRGRVFNGATMEAVGRAELTLINGEGTARTTSAEDGTFSIGPIEPSSSWRVAATANGMQSFEFTGVALAALDPVIGDQTRTLIGDVPLYPTSKMSPAFKLLVESSDARLPASVASINFAPAAVGTDPSKVADPLPAQVGLVSGAFAEPRGATMPNDARGSAAAFHTTINNGEAEVPEGALTWGATYNVKVDAGPDFTPVTFMLTPVKDGDISVVIPTTARYPTQLPQTTQQYFTGRV